MERLQGKRMAEMRPFLKMVGYYVSDNGNIKAIMKYKYFKVWVTPDGKVMPPGKKSKFYIGRAYNVRFSHWLNEDEKERFLKSEWYKNHPEPLKDKRKKKNKECVLNDL